MSVEIKEVETVKRQFDLLWPKPDTRIPEHRREKPVISGTVSCEFAYKTQEEAEALDAEVEAGTMTANQRFAELVPTINGLPTKDGETGHEFLVRHKFGSIIRQAIFDEYSAFMGDARQGNSKKRR